MDSKTPGLLDLILAPCWRPHAFILRPGRKQGKQAQYKEHLLSPFLLACMARFGQPSHIKPLVMICDLLLSQWYSRMVRGKTRDGWLYFTSISGAHCLLLKQQPPPHSPGSCYHLSLKRSEAESDRSSFCIFTNMQPSALQKWPTENLILSHPSNMGIAQATLNNNFICGKLYRKGR